MSSGGHGIGFPSLPSHCEMISDCTFGHMIYLNILHAIVLACNMLTCRRLLEAGANSVADLTGKRLIGVLCCQSCSTNATDVSLIKKLCRELKLEVWLPDGSGFSSGDICFSSPVQYFSGPESGCDLDPPFPNASSLSLNGPGGSTGRLCCTVGKGSTVTLMPPRSTRHWTRFMSPSSRVSVLRPRLV